MLSYISDKLPVNFSQTLQQEEDKKRPKFDASQLSSAPVQTDKTTPLKREKTKEQKARKEVGSFVCSREKEDRTLWIKVFKV